MEDNTAVTAYFDCVNQNYEKIRQICKDVCLRNKEKYSEDTLNDTVIQIHKIIIKKGQLDDMSCSGIMRYFVRSYVNNLRCEKRYAYVKKRDLNLTPEEFNEKHEQSLTSTKEKIKKDLFEDFAVLYVMKLVELNFDSEHFYLYRLKTLGQKTYKQIFDETGIKRCREKIIEVSNWLRKNVSRDDIKKEFYFIYGNLI